MNKINGVEMQWQADAKHCFEVMTSPIWQKTSDGNLDPDLIYEYGCKITAFLNCHNLFFKPAFMELKKLNEEIKKRNGYYYLYYKQQNKTIKEQKELCLGKESFVITSILQSILNIKKVIVDYKGKVDIKVPNEFFVVRTKYLGTGHYSMAIKNNLTYVDSYDGKIKIPNNILRVDKLIF